MTVYRGVTGASISMDGTRFYVKEDKEYDDESPVWGPIIARFPGYFRADNVEQATAGPGEKRNTRRG